MAKQYYIDENGNAIPVSGTITTAQMLPLTSSPTSPTTADAIASIGTELTASWTANSSSAYGTTLTDSISIDKGTWVISWGHPNQSANLGIFVDGIDVNSDISDKFITFDNGTELTKCSFVAKFTGNTTLKLLSGGSASVTFSNITRGFLRAVKVSAQQER